MLRRSMIDVVFKQKTAYGMRISDWSSDVCSSDLKGYPSKANRAWLRARGIAATIPERDDQIAHRRRHPGRPIDFGPDQRLRYRGRNVVERCFNKLKQWRGIAMRTDKTARSYRARSEEHTSELQSLMRISYAVFLLKKQIRTD